ncbi:MAG TPA: PilZ domain-containing protein [Pyrinomonadaceae bacterium]
MTRGGGERRRSPRYLVPEEDPLLVGLVVVGSAGRTLAGRVRDISETGLSILLPEGESCADLSKPGRELAAVLSLPSGVVRLRAEVVHCSAQSGGSGGQLVGACISEISAGDRDRLGTYIAERS